MTITNNTFFDNSNASDYGTPRFGQRVVAENMNKPKQPTPSNMPTLVHFVNILDRRTIEEVDPKDLEKNLGPGFKLVRVTLEITDSPVTAGVIDQRLPWLHALIGEDPGQHLPTYWLKIPRMAQDRIFFTGFRRDE